jgi:biopolymer transport protein ExbB
MNRALPNSLRALLPALAAILSLAGVARAGDKSTWWNDEWTIRKKITVDTTVSGANVADPIGSAAILLRLHDGNFQFGAAKDDGTDMRFTAEDDKTELKYHIERYDGLLNEAFVWVKVPDLKPNAKGVIYMYYGNAGPKATRVDDQKGTYDADTLLVYHFSEHNAPVADASGNGNNSKAAGVSVQGSLIAGGVRFDGKATIVTPTSPSLNWIDGGAMTWSAWIKPTALADNAVLFSRRDDAKSFVIGLDKGLPYVEVNGQRSQGGSGEALAVNAWRHLAVVAEGPKITIYVDGEPGASVGVALPALTADLVLGNDTKDGAAGFTGEVDELEISKVARPAGFLKLAALGQAGEKTAKAITYADDEQKAAGIDLGYVGIIMKSLTVDGWVVICILAVMAVFSWFVIFNKITLLNAVAKADSIFLEAWEHVATDLTVLDHEDEDLYKTMGGRMDKKRLRSMRSSCVFKIYHTGVEEIRHRIAGPGRRKGLSALSIQAIRAAMEGVLIREMMKLNGLIVFLTLSIAGGPFLGLLGTVVGVMITFAAIAAAGDVNVNSIAPGIAAALAATVAGLGVAIPALFGYNYILARVKNASNNMHIFIDEFCTKAAEFYDEDCQAQRLSDNSNSHAVKRETARSA